MFEGEEVCEVARLALGASPALGQGPGSEVCLACEACAGPGAAHAMQPEHTSVVCVRSGVCLCGIWKGARGTPDIHGTAQETR